MKITYQSLALIGLLFVLIGSFISYATPKDVVVARQLERNPDSWNLMLQDSARRLGDTNIQKEMLIRYINRACNPENNKRRMIEVSVLVGTIFALIGWIRERQYETKK